MIISYQKSCTYLDFSFINEKHEHVPKKKTNKIFITLFKCIKTNNKIWVW